MCPPPIPFKPSFRILLRRMRNLKTKTAKKRDRLISQSFDLAKLSQNLLKGEDLTSFIKRSIDLIK